MLNCDKYKKEQETRDHFTGEQFDDQNCLRLDVSACACVVGQQVTTKCSQLMVLALRLP